MKRKKMYLVHRKGFGCYPRVFTSSKLAENYVRFIIETLPSEEAHFAIIPVIPNYIRFGTGAIKIIHNLYCND